MPVKKRTTKKRRASKKAPSPAQLRARAKFVAMVRAKSRAAKSKKRASPKRRNKTIITKPKKVVVINPREIEGTTRKLVDELKRVDRITVGPGSNAYHTAKQNRSIFNLSKRQDGGYAISLKAAYRNPKAKSTRRKYHNGYLDLVIMGHAKKTPSGWSLGGKTFKQGKGIVPASRAGYYLDKATGTVFSKKARNVAQGFFDGNGVFHPIRSSADYNAGTAGETGRRPVHTRSKKRKLATKKASATARHKAETRKRKSTTSRLAGRSLRGSGGILKGSGSQRQRRNPAGITRRDVFEDSYKSRTGIGWIYEGLNVTQWRHIAVGGKIQTSSSDIPRHASRVEAKMVVSVLTRKNKTRNPSIKSIRKEFAGRTGKILDGFAPDGTPKNVAKLGTLKLIDTEDAKITPRGTVYLCADTKGKLHICGSKNAPIVDGPARSFGKINQIDYDESKPHLYPGKGRISFYHYLGEESGNKPTLYADGKGGLKIRGGSYRITQEGIVD